MTQVWRVFYLAATAIALSAADGGTVEGTVINSVTGEAVAGVKVEMKTPEGRTLTYRTETGSAGEFRFSNVDPGEHSVSYEKDGFGSPETEPSADTVQVTAQGTSQLHKKLDPLTTLEGHVLDEESHGVRRITVEVLTGRGQAQRSAFTDDAGDFRISDLHPGVYLLRATPDRPAWSGTPRTFEDLTSAAAAASLEKRILKAPFYYPGVPSKETATPIRISGEKALSGYDIRMPKLETYAIRGRLVSPGGDAVAKMTVKLKSADTSYFGNAVPPDAQVSTDSEGRFEFPTVTPGKWYLFAQSASYGPEPGAFLPVQVTRSDVEDLTLRMAAPFGLDVSLEGLPATASENRRARLQLTPVDGPIEQEVVAGGPKDGKLRVEHVFPGRYRFYVSPEAGHYIDSVLMGDRDVWGQEVELMAGAPPIRIVFKRDGGKVRGTVDGGAATVVLLPEVSSPDYWHSVRSDEQGRFEVGDLRPGNYLAIAVRQAGALQDPGFSALAEHDGTLVHVNAGEIAVADLRSTSWPK